MWMFKAAGMLILLTACTFLGLLKGSSTKKRAEKLGRFARCTSALAERISISESELVPLIKQNFPDGLIKVTDDGFLLDKAFLNSEDIAVLEEFLSDLGLSDPDSEYKRITAYSKIIGERGSEAHLNADSLCRMYKSCGFLGGLFLCIFFL